MARLFDDASNHVLSIDSAVVSGPPFTVAAWARSNDITVDQTVFYVGDKDVNDQHAHTLIMRGTAGGDPVSAISISTLAALATTTTGFSSGTWHHVCGVFAAVADRRAFIDGGSKGTDATSRTPVGLDRTAIGGTNDLTPGAYMSGDIAEAAVWDIALADADVALLAKGMSPLMVNPENLVAYWPLVGRHSPEIEIINGAGLTVTGATASDHPRMHYPGTPLRFAKPTVAAGGGKPWLYYARMRA